MNNNTVNESCDLAIIVAVSENGIIGRDGQLPWRLSADLKRFKRLTMGHALVMGRRTYESIGRPLPGRHSIVISRNPDFTATGCTLVDSWPSALAAARDSELVFAIGGQQVFESALPVARTVHLTRVHADVEGDVRFPEIDWTRWERTHRETHDADAKNEFDYSFEDYSRRE